MSLIRSLLGRRQFLIAAAMTSTAGMVSKKIARAFDSGIQTSVARASGLSASDIKVASHNSTVGMKSGDNRYRHLLSPLKIRNVIMKNRMAQAPGTPHFLQGPETYPADALRSFCANVAKSSAMVYAHFGAGNPALRTKELSDFAHMPMYDTSNPAVNNYIDQMVEGIHSMGALVIRPAMFGGFMGGPPTRPVTIQDVVTQAKQYEDQGVDVLQMMVGNIGNKDSMRTTIEQMQAIRKATNLIIMVALGVADEASPPQMFDSMPASACSMEDLIAAAKAFEGSADILQVYSSGQAATKPTSFNEEKGKPTSLRLAQAIKESGAKILVAPRAGFRDPDQNEEFIASGKCDIIVMVRAYICDPEYGKKIYEGRGEDVVPCIMCNKCHMLTQVKDGQWYSVCSVNPKLGIGSALKVIDAPTVAKKVAVIGGGPGGMKAAITAAERGHKVTLYEKNDFLGGNIRHADFSPYKWALKDFKDYLIREVNKAGVEVLLNMEATPEMIRSKRYDSVLAAVGSEPVIPRIPGADGSNVWNIVNVYGNEKKLGKKVVIIGGGDFGTETGIYLAKVGHNVTMLSSARELVPIDRVHYPEILIQTYDMMDNFSYILEATPTGISKGKVKYRDAKGKDKSIQADSVVVYAGLKARQDEALEFYGSAKNAFFTIGDCNGKGGTIQKVIRNAFFTASQV